MKDQFKQDAFFHDTKKLLWKSFKTHYNFLKLDPMGFFDQLTRSVEKRAERYYIPPERLRAVLVRFIDGALGKLIWCPQDQEETWKSFKRIGLQLTELKNLRVITDSYDLNDLYWSLIERYCYFMELTGAELKSTVCRKMKTELFSGALPWLALREQEEALETKGERLARTLVATEFKAQANEKGLLEKTILKDLA